MLWPIIFSQDVLYITGEFKFCNPQIYLGIYYTFGSALIIIEKGRSICLCLYIDFRFNLFLGLGQSFIAVIDKFLLPCDSLVKSLGLQLFLS